MRIFHWIDRYTGIYAVFSLAVAGGALLLVARQADSIAEAERNVQLAEKAVSYASTLEAGTVNSRAMGAVILFGEENREAKLVALGELPPDAPQVASALTSLRTLFFNDFALLLDQHGVVVAYSSDGKVHGIGADLSFRPYAKLAMQGVPSVYPAVGGINPARGIFLAAPVRKGLERSSSPIGAVVLRINAEKIDALLGAWTGGPAVLLSPHGVVFASSRADWLFHISGAADSQRLGQIARTRQFGDMFAETRPRQLPFALPAAEASIDGERYVIHSRQLEWGDPAGDWTLVMLDRRKPWWAQGSALGPACLAALIVGLLLFQLRAVARNAISQQDPHRELAIAAATFESHEGVLITDANGMIVKVNRAFTEVTGYTGEEAVGRSPSMLASGRHDADFYALMWKRIRREKIWRGEIWNRRKNGEIYPEQLTITPIFDANGEVANYVGIFSDITQRKEAEQEILTLAFYDALTGLPNRRLLNERLEHAMAAGQRDRSYGAVMFMDMDRFKQLNDTHGHGMGDLLLVEVAQRITGCVREVDTVARFGGDEFVVLLGELDAGRQAAATHAGAVAEKIRAALAQPYALTLEQKGSAPFSVEHRCSSSIGVVLFLGHAATREEILKWADIAMYQAKADGRNLIRFYEEQS